MAVKFKLPTKEEIAALSFDETKELAESVAFVHEEVQAKLKTGVTAEIEKLAKLANIEVTIGGKLSETVTKATRTSKPRVDASAQKEINAAGAAGIEEAEVVAKLVPLGFPEDKIKKALLNRSKGDAKWFTKKGTKYFPRE